jgi:hypothetical protein
MVVVDFVRQLEDREPNQMVQQIGAMNSIVDVVNDLGKKFVVEEQDVLMVVVQHRFEIIVEPFLNWNSLEVEKVVYKVFEHWYIVDYHKMV